MPKHTTSPIKERRQALYGLLRILQRQAVAMADGADPDLDAMLGIVDTLRRRAQARAALNLPLWPPIALEADRLGEHLHQVIDGAIMRRQLLATECRRFARRFRAALAAEGRLPALGLTPPGTYSGDDALLLFRSLRRQMQPARVREQDGCSLCAG